MAKKITQNVNKDAGLLKMPKVTVPKSKWKSEHSNYISSNIGDIVPIYCEEIIPNERKKVTMGMLSHMTTPIAPVFNAQYTEFRAFFVPHRLSADLLAGYKTRKSPWVKVFGEDNASANSSIIVSLANQKLPQVSTAFVTDVQNGTHNAFGGILDALDLEAPMVGGTDKFYFYKGVNFLNLAAYELIYQKAYRNQNRESATNSSLYQLLFDAYNRTGNITLVDKFHKANREKDYFTGSQPFTLKASSPVSVGILGTAPVKADFSGTTGTLAADSSLTITNADAITSTNRDTYVLAGDSGLSVAKQLFADLSNATGVNIEQLRVMIKTQELLEKDMMYGSDYASSLNAHFGCAPISEILEEPFEIKKVTITSRMQPIFQTSSTTGEQTILGTIGANATTQSGEFEIVPETLFKEYGYLMICAVHKAQNAYDSFEYKPLHIFKNARFDYFTPELNDLGYQKVPRKQFKAGVYTSLDDAVSFNEAFAEYRFPFNKIHGMFEASRSGALDYWVLGISGVNDVQTLYKQGEDELNRAISVSSTVSPSFYDAYGFVEINEKPMSLHSIPGMDGVI